jgi:hypothetical protein
LVIPPEATASRVLTLLVPGALQAEHIKARLSQVTVAFEIEVIPLLPNVIAVPPPFEILSPKKNRRQGIGIFA